jgi:hypothetical protein
MSLSFARPRAAEPLAKQSVYGSVTKITGVADSKILQRPLAIEAFAPVAQYAASICTLGR